MGTGSTEPVEWLLDVLARPHRPSHFDPYHANAARALVMIEFSERTLDREFGPGLF